jgi:hypothetical protein
MPRRPRGDELSRAIQRYIDPAAVEAALADSAAGTLTEGEIGYALVMVRGEPPEELSARMGRVADLGAEHGACADAITSGLVVLSFGTFPAHGPGDRAGVVAALLLDLGADVKIVHGAATGHYGTLGGPKRFAYGFIISGFDEALGRLSALKYGDTEEYPPGFIE